MMWVCLCWMPSLRAHEDDSVEIQRLSQEIVVHPEDAALFLERGEMYRFSRHWHMALADYGHAAKLDPGLSLVDLAWGMMWNDAGDGESALPKLDRFLEREPRNAKGHAERARAARMLKRWPAALADYALAVSYATEPGPDAFIDWADCLLESGDRTQALAVLDQGLARLGPVVSLQLRALAMEEQGGLSAAALKRIDAMLAGPGRKDSLLLRKARILMAASRPKEARQTAELALREFEALPETAQGTPAAKELREEITQLIQKIPPTSPP